MRSLRWRMRFISVCTERSSARRANAGLVSDGSFPDGLDAPVAIERRRNPTTPVAEYVSWRRPRSKHSAATPGSALAAVAAASPKSRTLPDHKNSLRDPRKGGILRVQRYTNPRYMKHSELSNADDRNLEGQGFPASCKVAMTHLRRSRPSSTPQEEPGAARPGSAFLLLLVRSSPEESVSSVAPGLRAYPRSSCQCTASASASVGAPLASAWWETNPRGRRAFHIPTRQRSARNGATWMPPPASRFRTCKEMQRRERRARTAGGSGAPQGRPPRGQGSAPARAAVAPAV